MPVANTIPNAPRRSTHAIVAATAAIDIGWSVFDAADIVVKKDGVTLTTGFSITGSFGADAPALDAAVAFSPSVANCTIDIISARAPRREAQFVEGLGVTAKARNYDMNQALAALRDTFDALTNPTSGAVVSVAGRTGAVTLFKADVGLSNVDNTSDANKPISTAAQTALNAKAASTHSHAISDVTSLQTTLDGKALTSHSHAIADVTNLQTTLNGKASSTHSHAIADVTGLQTALDGKAASSHGHAIADVTDLQATLDAKEPLGEVFAINTQTGTTYTLVIGDKGKIVETNNAGANTLTVPPNASVAFPVKTRIDLVQFGAGQTTIAAGSGVTIRSSGAKLKLSGQYSAAALYKRATDEWVLIGDLAT